MRNNVARDIIRQRRARNMILPYMEHIDIIVKAQSHVRVFLARRRLATLKKEEEDIDREIASMLIQRNFRFYIAIKRQREASRITRFIRKVPFLRERRLKRIRENLSRIRIQRAAREWVRRHSYVELPRFQTNMARPAQERIQTYLNDRNARRQARQHNWDVLNRRLRNIRRDIDDIIAPERQENRAVTARALPDINVRVPGAVERPARIPMNPTLLDHMTLNVPPTVATIRPAPILPRLPASPVRGRQRHRDIPIRDPTPPLARARPNVNQRLQEIEDQFRDPRIRAIYQNNRIIMPDGNRVLPAPGGGLRLQPDPHNIGTPNLPDTPTVSPTNSKECPICMERKPNFRMINPGCDHLICFRCAQGMVTAALGNVTTNIPIKCPMSGNGCEEIVTPYTDGIRPLIATKDFDKFERYHILKTYVPSNRLRYCPNSSCGMPFEINDNIVDEITSPPREVSFRFSACCTECDTLICIYCNDFAHPNMSCREFQERQKDGSEATSEYIKNYCKKCPLCKVNVQKQQTPEQEHHERTTGMAGGTSECHHVTCGACKGDFCWTCLKTYTGATYYHRTCPNNDCTISFINGIPNVSHLPIGQHMYIKLVTYSNAVVMSQRVYQINNSRVILGAKPEEYHAQNKTVIIHCDDKGIVKRLEGLLGDYSFRQNNKP